MKVLQILANVVLVVVSWMFGLYFLFATEVLPRKLKVGDVAEASFCILSFIAVLFCFYQLMKTYR